MRCKAIYDALLFALILFLSGPTIASPGTSGETAGQVSGPRPASISSSPPAVSAAQKTSVLLDEVPPKRLPLAPSSLGLKLVGTVVARDAKMSLAVIEKGGAGKQRIYYEGARAGKVLIKKVLRNEVIIDAGRGEVKLTMLHGQASGSSRSGRSVSRQIPQRASTSRPVPGRHQSVHLDREEVVAALSDLNKVTRQVHFTPYTVYDESEGIKVRNITPGSLLSKIGLRNGDIIKGVNDAAITGPDQVAVLFQKLREGGEVIVKVKGRRRTRRIHLQIQ
jgi:general secretion pathway protein C